MPHQNGVLLFSEKKYIILCVVEVCRKDITFIKQALVAKNNQHLISFCSMYRQTFSFFCFSAILLMNKRVEKSFIEEVHCLQGVPSKNRT